MTQISIKNRTIPDRSEITFNSETWGSLLSVMASQFRQGDWITVNILSHIHCTEVTSHVSTCEYKTAFSISASFLKFITNYFGFRLFIINRQIILQDGWMKG